VTLQSLWTQPRKWTMVTLCDLPRQASPAAEDARPAAVGKLFSEQMCTCQLTLSSPLPSLFRFLARRRTAGLTYTCDTLGHAQGKYILLSQSTHYWNVNARLWSIILKCNILLSFVAITCRTEHITIYIWSYYYYYNIFHQNDLEYSTWHT